jgi:hypothetical protein
MRKSAPYAALLALVGVAAGGGARDGHPHFDGVADRLELATQSRPDLA